MCCSCGEFSFFLPSQEIGWEERLRNDLFCVEWDVEPHLSQSVNQSQNVASWHEHCPSPPAVISLYIYDTWIDIILPVSRLTGKRCCRETGDNPGTERISTIHSLHANWINAACFLPSVHIFRTPPYFLIILVGTGASAIRRCSRRGTLSPRN